MNQEETNLSKILAKYLNNECSDSELKILHSWLSESKENQKVLDDLMNSKTLEGDLIIYNSFNKQAAWENIASHIEKGKSNIFKINYMRFLLAASVVIVLFSVSFLYYFKYNTLSEPELSSLAEGKVLRNVSGEILPATTGAILVKSNGEQVTLDHSFVLNEDGSIAFDEENIVEDKDYDDEESFYELIVPKAKIIQFAMFDGSKIWVNANSRLQIPTKSNADRKIKLLSGEIYLEVAKYKNSKFLVETQNGLVEVLGTKFNVISSAKSFKTTLVEGKVKLVKEQIEQILEPNTSGLWRNNEFVVTRANLNADLAWKNNVFYFNNYSINRIANQIEDWYGVKVHVDADVSKNKNTYSGEMRRDVPLKEVKKMLEFISGLHVSIEGENLNVENK
jgi:transmembrane sensor